MALSIGGGWYWAASVSREKRRGRKKPSEEM
jgi:hypothetical protein